MESPLGQRLRELPGPLLLTGHTGFKGTWMTLLLEHLNIPVVGYSLSPEKGSLFDRSARIGAIPEMFSDIRDYQKLATFIQHHKPSTIIHMAAQPLVLKSYKNPLETFEINVMGTANVLDISSKCESVKAIVIVTSDKVYRNNNSGDAFVESDPLEGQDPYSASKVATEAVVKAWQNIVSDNNRPAIISVRAGNVIGGGDFGEDRIVPDLIRGIMEDKKVTIRNLESTRPWQHVLDPLVGYLLSLEKLFCVNEIKNLNFGPKDKNLTVSQLVEIAIEVFPELSNYISYIEGPTKSLEAKFLELDSKLSRDSLGWEPLWTQEEAIRLTFKWWQNYIAKPQAAHDISTDEIKLYFTLMKLKERK